MRAELRHIDPNDCAGWDAFASEHRPDPGDGFGWFTLDIGVEGESGADMFEVLIATPAAVSRARPASGPFRGIIVESFEPDAIARKLKALVSSVTGKNWTDIVAQLRHSMRWEYEGMDRV
ncbi:MAG: immunity 8 family protein [Gemmataceae bacterium]|nr:immunity 8 family protein [Gemmataceae bacterium]